VCDNGGFAVIDKLQRNTGNVSFNNQIADCQWDIAPFAVDFTMHARSMGARSESVSSVAAFEAAFAQAKGSDRTYVIEVSRPTGMDRGRPCMVGGRHAAGQQPIGGSRRGRRNGSRAREAAQRRVI
jgi:TPP-dependent trihydroxycyclohexane-1,2-dione (THcHDO) dehydratase